MVLGAVPTARVTSISAKIQASSADEGAHFSTSRFCKLLLGTTLKMTQQSLSYRDAGVDIDAGDELVERIKPFAKKTMREGVLSGLGGFGAQVLKR